MSENNLGIGIIGTGRRGHSLGVCAAELYHSAGVEVRALCNRTRLRMEQAKDSLVKIYQENNVSPSISLYQNYQDLVDAPEVDLIMITTPQYTHKDQAVYALESGKKVFLDKPIAHNLEDALAIRQQEIRESNPMTIGFTRRFEAIWNKTFNLVTEGVIGNVKMMLIRNLIPYHTYFHTWHRKLEWSGGALADKMSHFFDVFNWFSGSYPERVSAYGGQSVFAPDTKAPARCSECDSSYYRRTKASSGRGELDKDCPYRVGEKKEKARQDTMVDFDNSRFREKEIIKRHDNCVWLPGADINDHGIVNLVYPDGLKAVLFWSIFGPDSNDQETFELVGTRGKIVLSRHTGNLEIISDYGNSRQEVEVKDDQFTASHFGADHRLIMELEQFYKGSPPVVSGKEGVGAARIVEAAHRSIQYGGKPLVMKDIQDVE
ncbi:MAG: Gfo/Idh/MocA family protein [Spirochaetota bacterium]